MRSKYGILDLSRTSRPIIDPADYERRLPIPIAWLVMLLIASILWAPIWAIFHFGVGLL